MLLKTFRGPDLGKLLKQAEAAFGGDAAIVQHRMLQGEGGRVMEIVAARAADIDRFRRRLTPAPLFAPAAPRPARPLVIALVGPTGAGKTTVAAKLAIGAEKLGNRRVGLLTLDTYRVGGLEQLGTYAELAGIPLEVAYHPLEIPEALRRLATCEVIVVDTPGRSPRARELNENWRALLAEVSPDEVHLVLPATLRTDVALAVRAAFAPFGVSHLLPSKLDEVPGECGVADLALQMDLPARWITDGQDVPADLHDATPRVLATLGAAPAQSELARQRAG